jgi:two-component system phosphate regulon sensor histidine kinase PhoR
MTEGVALVQGGAITVANPAFQTLLGVTSAPAGRAPLEARREPELAEAIARATTERAPVRRELVVGRHTLSVQVLPLGADAPGAVVVVLLDVTEARRLERMRRDLVANASHELRTPVAAIVGAAETLADGAADDPKLRASFVDILQRHAQRLSRLTADLLDLSRLEAGYRPRIESVSLVSAVASV